MTEISTQIEYVVLGPKDVGKTSLSINIKDELEAELVDSDLSQHNHCATNWLGNSIADQPIVYTSAKIYDTDGAKTIQALREQHADDAVSEDVKWGADAKYIIVMSIGDDRKRKEGLQLMKDIRAYGDFVAVVVEDREPNFAERFKQITDNNPWVVAKPFTKHEGMGKLYDQGLHAGTIKKDKPENLPLITNISELAKLINEGFAESAES